MDRAERPAQELHPAGPVPVREPVRAGDRRGGAKIYIDSGNYEPALDKALTMAGYRTSTAKKAEAKTRGKLLGIGLSAPTSRSAASRRPSGSAPSARAGAPRCGSRPTSRSTSPARSSSPMGTQPQGQGHETTYAQVVVARARGPDGGRHRPALGHPGHAVRLRLVRQPDELGRDDRGDQGGGQGPRQGPSLRRPHARGERRGHRGRRREVPGQGLARQGQDHPGDRLRARPRLRPARRAWSRTSTKPPTTTPRTAPGRSGRTSRSSRSTRRPGKVELVRYVAVDDVGNKINPMIVDGQLHGGIAQGVGQALWEGAIYSDDGQLLTGSMLDYALPRASWLPNLELDETVTPSPVNPLGVKGVGEAGAIASTAAVANAVIDALEPARYPTSRHAVHAADRLAGDPGCEGRPGVIPAAFAYQRPASLDEALRVIAIRSRAKVIAGGQSLLPLMKLRLATADTLVDIGRLTELKGAGPLPDGGFEIGCPDHLRRGARTDVAGLCPRLPVGHRRRPGAQSRHDRRRHRPLPTRPRMRRRWRWRSTIRSSSGRRAASASFRWTGSSRARSRPGSPRTRSSWRCAAVRCPRVPPARTRSWSNRRRATPSSGSAAVVASHRWVHHARPGRPDRGGRDCLSRQGRGSGAAGK